MLNSADIARLNEISRQLEALYKPLPIDEYNSPVNRTEERDTLFKHVAAGNVYHPQFSYRSLPCDLVLPLLTFLRQLQPERDAWEFLLYQDVKQTLDSLQAVSTHDAAAITATSIAADGLPTRALIDQAYVELAQPIPIREDETVSAEAAADALRTGLEHVGLTSWRVIIDPVMSVNMSVRTIEQQVKIRQDSQYSLHSIRRLLVHEIGTHVFRYANAEKQPLFLLRLGLTGYMMTEEGMATYHEAHYGLRDMHTARRYALRVIAAQMSLTHSYFDVFSHIAQYTTQIDAFDIVTRSKRGFSNTADYGAHVKDKVYLEGFYAVNDHLKAVPSDYTLLMSGKVSLKMLPLLHELRNANLLLEPQYLPAQLMA